MKKYIYISILLFFGFSSFAQTNVYHPFPDSNAVWRVDFYSDPPYYFHREYQYLLDGDTVIGSYHYRKINREGDCCYFIASNNGYIGALRDDTTLKRIYVILQDSLNEILLYDFGLNIGDTISGLYSQQTCGNPSLVTVASIDSILVHGDYRKRLNFEPNGYLKEHSIIEGIGSRNGLFEGFYHHSDCGYRGLMCFKVNNLIYFPDTATSYSCDLNTNVLLNNEAQNGIKIFPNPASEKLYISFKSKYYSGEINIRCFNVLGQNVKINFDKQLNSIAVDVSSLYNGTYILSIYDKINLLKNEKLIIISP